MYSSKNSQGIQETITWADANFKYRYTCIVKLSKLVVNTREQKHDEHGTSFQSFLKINHMLITRLIRIRWQLTTPYQLVSPSKFCSFKFFFFFGHWGTVFLFSKVINSFKQPNSWTDLFWKSFLHKMCMAPVTPQFLCPVFTVSVRNDWDLDPLWHAHMEKKRNTCILRVLLLK